MKNYAPKKKITKTFDTKLFLFGSGFLLVLLILGLFFTGSLFRRSADSMFAAANQSYEKASYAQAISRYDSYISSFPNHSGISTAKIRRALARIRFAVDEQSDYINAYNIAAEEIASVENEPNFFEVSKAELSVLLPKIAVGLANEAQEKVSLFCTERAELTLALLDKLLPNSLYPVEQIAEVKARIKIVRRTIACQNAVKEATEKINNLHNTPSFDRKHVENCYTVLNSLLPEYPELAAQKEFKDLVRAVAEKESQAVSRTAAPEIDAKVPDTGITEPAVNVLAVLVKQSISKENKTNPQVYPFYYDENLYGIRLSDGSLIWKQTLKEFVPKGMRPEILYFYSSKNITQDGFILANTENGTFRQYSSGTGQLLAEFSLKEKIFVSGIAQNDTECLFAASTESGILTFFKVNSDSEKPAVSCIAAYQVPQKVDSPPLIDLQGGTALQFAQSQTLFVIPLEQRADMHNAVSSYYTGHSPRTIRTAPAMFGTYCLFIRQTGADTCELVVFSLEKETKEHGLQTDIIQTLPISGLVDFPMQISGNRCAVLSDSGEIPLFEIDGNSAEPLRLLGRGSADNYTGKYAATGINRSAVIAGNGIWIAGRQLMLFALQPAQNRILPMKTLRTDIETGIPLFLNYYNKNQLIHSFTEPEWGGLQIAANDITANDSAAYKTLWKTELAAAIIQEPQLSVKDEKKSLTVYTSNGKSWEVPLEVKDTDKNADKNTFDTLPVLELPAGTFGTVKDLVKSVKVPLGKVIQLKDGYSAWTAAGNNTAGKEIKVFDPSAKENKFPSISLSSPPAALLLALDGYLLVPLQNNSLVLYDVKTCTLAATFKPLLHIGKDALWTNPAVLPSLKSFIIADNQTGEQNNSPVLYEIALKNDGGKFLLVQEKCFTLERPVVSQLTVMNNNAANNIAVFTDDRNVLHRLNLNVNEPQNESSEKLTGKCVWGPYCAGSGGEFILATEDGKVWCYTADGQLHTEPKFVPSGLPFCTENSILLNSADGNVRQFSRKNFQLEFSIETKLKLSAGPVMFGNTVYLSGKDGTVYTLSHTVIDKQQ